MSSLFERAQARIPGGVDSPVRSFASVGGDPFFVARGEGAYLFDTDGRRYIDYVQSWGASILGHAHPAVVDAVQRAAAAGTSYGAPTEREVELAEAIAARVPSVEKVRLVSSGTEAAMTAVRLARGATGRAKVLKFAGCYHGHVDALLVAAGSGVATLGLPGSAGVTEGTVADTVVVPYNDEAALDEAFDRYGAELAAVLVEPVAANMGLVAPADGFLAGLRRRCTDAGALLVCDEVITGFRLGPAGAQGAFGITPDLSMFGKVVGGGLPLAAVGGRAEIMDHLAPVGPVYQAGTLSGNPVATAAGLAVLNQLDAAAYAALERTATRFADGLRAALPDAQITQVGYPHRHLLLEHPGHELRTGATRGPQAVRDVLPPHARRRYLPRPERLRDLFREPGAHRRDHRRDDRRGGLRLRRVVVLGKSVPPHVVHEEQGAADGDDHDDHEDEGQAARTVALLARVDQLLSARGRRECEHRPDRAQAEPEERTDPSHLRHTFASSDSSGAGTATGPAFSASSAIWSFSRQCRARSPRPNRIRAMQNATNGGTRSDPRSRFSTT